MSMIHILIKWKHLQDCVSIYDLFKNKKNYLFFKPRWMMKNGYFRTTWIAIVYEASEMDYNKPNILHLQKMTLCYIVGLERSLVLWAFPREVKEWLEQVLLSIRKYTNSNKQKMSIIKRKDVKPHQDNTTHVSLMTR